MIGTMIGTGLLLSTAVGVVSGLTLLVLPGLHHRNSWDDLNSLRQRTETLERELNSCREKQAELSGRIRFYDKPRHESRNDE